MKAEAIDHIGIAVKNLKEAPISDNLNAYVSKKPETD